MFNYRKNNNGDYFILWDGFKWEFWPFEWIYIKNNVLWFFLANYINLAKYPWYKYSIWKKWEYIYIVNNSGLEDIVKIMNIPE